MPELSFSSVQSMQEGETLRMEASQATGRCLVLDYNKMKKWAFGVGAWIAA